MRTKRKWDEKTWDVKDKHDKYVSGTNMRC